MSKQVKLKFKKLLKNAEFVLADLEYHEEMLPDAKQEFFAAAQGILNELPDEVKKRFADEQDKKIIERSRREQAEESVADDEQLKSNGLATTQDILEDAESLPDGPEGEVPPVKEAEIKKLFRQIASVSHPDKLIGDISEREKNNLETIFKNARRAYKENNWYILYSIALELEMEVKDPHSKHLEWLEEDIKNTKSKISHIGSLVVWVWYTGDEDSKRYALQNYFQQVYDYTIDSP